MPGTRLSCGVTQCGEATGKFHVQAFPVLDRGVPGGNITAAPLQHVCYAHASGAAHQAPPDVKMRPEYADEVADTECGDSSKVFGRKL